MTSEYALAQMLQTAFRQLKRLQGTDAAMMERAVSSANAPKGFANGLHDSFQGEEKDLGSKSWT